jgi:FdhD protein
MPQPGVIEVGAHVLGDLSAAARPTLSRVIEEDTLTLDIEDIGLYTLMWTPTMDCSVAHGYTSDDGMLGDLKDPESLAIAAGFVLSEGFIRQRADIGSISVCPEDHRVVRIQLREPKTVQTNRRNVVINSSCGICGPREMLENGDPGLRAVGSRLTLAAEDLARLMQEMRIRQTLFEATGGCHGAAIFDQQGGIIAVAEDLGRHNALDKAIGKVLLNRGDLSGCGVVLSSRLSFEMVLKAIRAGLEIMLAASAPTSMAIAFAEKFGITLCGFVRETRATIYAHPWRIRNLTSQREIGMKDQRGSAP